MNIYNGTADSFSIVVFVCRKKILKTTLAVKLKSYYLIKWFMNRILIPIFYYL